MLGFERVLADCLSRLSLLSYILLHINICIYAWGCMVSDSDFVYALDHQRLFKRRELSINTAAKLNAPKKEKRWHGHTQKEGEKERDKRRLKERKARDSWGMGGVHSCILQVDRWKLQLAGEEEDVMVASLMARSGTVSSTSIVACSTH